MIFLSGGKLLQFVSVSAEQGRRIFQRLETAERVFRKYLRQIISDKMNYPAQLQTKIVTVIISFSTISCGKTKILVTEFILKAFSQKPLSAGLLRVFHNLEVTVFI